MRDRDDVVESVGFSRRSFVKKLVAVGFAVPVVSTFALDASAHGGILPGFPSDQDTFISNSTSGGFDQGCDTLPHGHDDSCETDHHHEK
jgi:hypothetical protein